VSRFDRALGILLLLRAGKTISAPELARRFEVSTRTIYRDIDTLSAVGVPVYAEIGRDGGFRLVEGYFLPPVAFSVGEATSLLTGLALLHRLRARPFAPALETAAQKLLAVVPDQLREVLAQAQRIIGFEAIPHDIFHPERAEPTDTSGSTPPASGDSSAAQVITTFLQCIFDRHAVALQYHSPYRSMHDAHVVMPYGILWDRDRWYLVGRRADRGEEPRLWRADRVVSIARHPRHGELASTFDITDMLGRSWLTEAMAQWMDSAPVVIRVTCAQADRLRQDWYYGHARFEEQSDGDVVMTYGEGDQQIVFELLRWLGPGAELIAPAEWRAAFAAELRALLAPYGP
jgi:predicted DNA-binding transcriptional regulator YafY